MEINRDYYLNKLIECQGNGMIKVVTGIRRCGKSYLLLKLFRDHLLRQGVDDDHIIQVDLENRKNMALRDPDALMQHIDDRMRDNGMYYILIDEVQWVNEFEDVLNSYLKVANADVYVTGSNSRFLSTDVITEFRGRGYEIKVHPLCFREFFSVYPGSREQALADYMTYGGMTQVALLPNAKSKAQYLKDLFRKVYLTDVKERHKIKNDGDLEEFIDLLASSIGGLTNPNKLSNTFASVKHSKLSAPTIKSYLDILQEAFLLERAVRYDIKGKRYIDTPAKYYFCDVGLRNARINFRQHEPTHLMENLIYNELRVRDLSVDVGVVMVHEAKSGRGCQRVQLEVDFVCNEGSKRCYIQSALRLSSEEKRQQEVRSLLQIGDNFQKFVITDDPINRYQADNGIIFMNIYEFLLDDNSLVN